VTQARSVFTSTDAVTHGYLVRVTCTVAASDLRWAGLRPSATGAPSAGAGGERPTRDGMKLDSHRVRTLSNRGFMSFRRALSAWTAVLAVLAGD
jgi:hypothetical protein